MVSSDRIPPPFLPELHAIRAEGDPELQAEALLALARRMENANQFEPAGEIYRELVGTGSWRNAWPTTNPPWKR